MNSTAVDVSNIPTKYFNYGILIIVLGLAAIVKEVSSKKKVVTPKPEHFQINKSRKSGKWLPETFQTPIPKPYPDWDYKLTSPLPYRAFKHKYNINMGIRSMDWESWFELDNQWPKFHNEKLNRLEKYGRGLFETSKEAIPAAYELLDEMRQYLSHRYPQMFVATEDGMKNIITGEDFKFLGKYRDYDGTNPERDPSRIAANFVQDDLAIMMENSNGEYQLKGGAIILPGFWKFREKFNLTLNDIHTTGDVPKFQEKLKNGMEKFFVRLSCDKPVVRNNYFLQTDEQLGWSSSIGNELTEKVGWGTATEAQDVNKIHLRSERQSLRRLPKSGAIIFTVRTYFIPVTEICKEPYIPRRLLNGILSWTEDVQEYRGYAKFKDVLLPYLEQKAEEQEKQGYLPDNEPNEFPF